MRLALNAFSSPARVLFVSYKLRGGASGGYEFNQAAGDCKAQLPLARRTRTVHGSMLLVGALAGGAHTKISLSEMLKMWPKMMTMMTMLTTSVLRPGPSARRSSLAVVFPFSLVVCGRYFLYPVQAKLTE